MLKAPFTAGGTRLPFPLPLHPSQGAVYGVALNHRPLVERLGASLEDAPYKGAPKAPILYVKPQNTLSGDGAVVHLPAPMKGIETGGFEIGATLAVMIGQSATRIDAADAAKVIAGYAVAADLSLPHASYYRPAIREKCLDRSMPIGGTLYAPAAIGDVAALAITTSVDGKAVHSWSLADLVRPLPRLIADIAEFMTLRPGDILLVGVADGALVVSAGHAVTVEIPGMDPLSFSIAAPENGDAQ